MRPKGELAYSAIDFMNFPHLHLRVFTHCSNLPAHTRNAIRHERSSLQRHTIAGKRTQGTSTTYPRFPGTDVHGSDWARVQRKLERRRRGLDSIHTQAAVHARCNDGIIWQRAACGAGDATKKTKRVNKPSAQIHNRHKHLSQHIGMGRQRERSYPFAGISCILRKSAPRHTATAPLSSPLTYTSLSARPQLTALIGALCSFADAARKTPGDTSVNEKMYPVVDPTHGVQVFSSRR